MKYPVFFLSSSSSPLHAFLCTFTYPCFRKPIYLAHITEFTMQISVAATSKTSAVSSPPSLRSSTTPTTAPIISSDSQRSAPAPPPPLAAGSPSVALSSLSPYSLHPSGTASSIKRTTLPFHFDGYWEVRRGKEHGERRRWM